MVHVMLFPMINILYFNISTFQSGVRGGVVVKVAGSIPDGVIGIFQWHYFRSHYGPGVNSASNRNEYQVYFLGVKVAGA